jgi:hypothetical protein
MSNPFQKIQPDKLPRIAIISSERYPHHDTNTQQIIKNASALHFAGLPVELIIPVQAKSFFSPTSNLIASIYKYYNVTPGLKIRVLWNVPASDLRLEKFFHSFAATLRAVFDKKIDLIYTRNKFVALLALFLGKKFMCETYRRMGAAQQCGRRVHVTGRFSDGKIIGVAQWLRQFRHAACFDQNGSQEKTWFG